LGAGGQLTFATSGQGRPDVLDFYGTSASDNFMLNGSANGRARIVRASGAFATIVVNTNAIKTLDVHGLEGDDAFNVVSGTAAWTSGLILDGGDPSASDVANLSGASGAVN